MGTHVSLHLCTSGYSVSQALVTGCAQSCATLCDLVTVARQAPLSMGFSRQEYWSGLPFPPPGSLPDPRIQLQSPVSSALAGGFFTTEPRNHLSLEGKTNFLNPPGGASGKASACQCRRSKRCR